MKDALGKVGDDGSILGAAEVAEGCKNALVKWKMLEAGWGCHPGTKACGNSSALTLNNVAPVVEEAGLIVED